MAIFGKKRKKNASKGRFEKITVQGKALPILNFYLFTNNKEQKRYIELSALDTVEELHFSQVTMEVFLTAKKLIIDASFADAFQKGKFKVYKFQVLSLKEYYI